MDYTLAILTHGNGDKVAQALRSFTDKVKPEPTRILVHCDGPRQAEIQAHGVLAEQHFDSVQRGFCAATRRLWHWAASPTNDQTPFTFWLEHDFVFLRPVDLRDLADVLDADKKLAQMQLMRTPVNEQEIAAGGLYQSRPGEYQRALHRRFDHVREGNMTAYTDQSWLRHRSYFTTNPSLMRTDFMTWNHWPDDDEPHCEGRFGIDLVRRGFYFGVWGSGEPWVEHVGRRDGFGY